jgi:alkylation response protein AidB-like acyl-CoA dehydrogenase
MTVSQHGTVLHRASLTVRQRRLTSPLLGKESIARLWLASRRRVSVSALGWVRDRIRMGRPPAEHPVIAAMIGDMATAIDAGPLLCLRAAWYNARPGRACSVKIRALRSTE